MSSTDLLVHSNHGAAARLRADVVGLGRRNLDEARIEVLLSGLESMLRRWRLSYEGLLAGGAESVVVSACRGSRRVVLKGAVDPHSAVAESQFLSSLSVAPDVIDVDAASGVVAMVHVDGVALRSVPITDPAQEWSNLVDLVDTVEAADLDPAGLPSFSDQFTGRGSLYLQACTASGRDGLASAVEALRARQCVEFDSWVALDLHPKNILVDGEGRWWLIDPMPTRHTHRWCFAKWVVCRRDPGLLPGAAADMWRRFHSDPEFESDVFVWEVGSKLTVESATATLDQMVSVLGTSASP